MRVARYGRDKGKFLADFPEAKRGIMPLVKRIREKYRLNRASKNGTPQERALKDQQAQAQG